MFCSYPLSITPTYIVICYIRAVIKSRGPGISPGYYECGPRLLLLENRRKIEPNEIPSCLIPHLLIVFTRQLEILVTTLLHSFRLCVIIERQPVLCRTPWPHMAKMTTLVYVNMVCSNMLLP